MRRVKKTKIMRLGNKRASVVLKDVLPIEVEQWIGEHTKVGDTWIVDTYEGKWVASSQVFNVNSENIHYFRNR